MNNDFFAPETEPKNNAPDSNFSAPNPNKGNGKATASLVLGILSLVTCCCFGLPGMILAVIGFILALSSRNGQKMSGAAVGGLICCIIGFILSAASLAFWIFDFYVTSLYLADPQACYDWLVKTFGKAFADAFIEGMKSQGLFIGMTDAFGGLIGRATRADGLLR